ncbi:MAG: hypothetical protein EBS53_00710 [Bacteroidetes bacterium]|nr:hypothetical protein [Bacteroidota bacterium]
MGDIIMAEPQPTTKRRFRKRWILYGLLGGMAWYMYINATGPAPVAAAKTPEQLANDKRENATTELYIKVRQSMKDPNSLEVDELLANDDGSVACMRYRGRNSFNALNREIAVAVGPALTRTDEAWKKHCTGEMVDMTWSVRNAEAVYNLYSR